MKLCASRFGCLVQKGRHMKLCVPRFGCRCFGELNLEGVGSEGVDTLRCGFYGFCKR